MLESNEGLTCLASIEGVLAAAPGNQVLTVDGVGDEISIYGNKDERF